MPSSTAQQPSKDGDIVFMGITHDDDDDITEKHQQVAQNITQSIAQSANTVGEAAVLDVVELQLIKSCLGQPITLTDTKAEDSPMKVTTKRKKKRSKNEQDQSHDR